MYSEVLGADACVLLFLWKALTLLCVACLHSSCSLSVFQMSHKTDPDPVSAQSQKSGFPASVYRRQALTTFSTESWFFVYLFVTPTRLTSV